VGHFGYEPDRQILDSSWFGHTLKSIQQTLHLMTCEPHARCLKKVPCIRLVPPEMVTFRTAKSIDVACGAALVPESSALPHCTVVIIGSISPLVVVAVVRGEHHSIMITESIVAGVTGEPRYLQLVVVRLALYCKRIVLGPQPRAINAMQVKSQLVAAVQCQLTEQIVAKPVVASVVAEPNLKLRPRTIKEIRSINVLLDHQWDTFGCRTNVYINKFIVYNQN